MSTKMPIKMPIKMNASWILALSALSGISQAEECWRDLPPAASFNRASCSKQGRNYSAHTSAHASGNRVNIFGVAKDGNIFASPRCRSRANGFIRQSAVYEGNAMGEVEVGGRLSISASGETRSGNAAIKAEMEVRAQHFSSSGEGAGSPDLDCSLSLAIEVATSKDRLTEIDLQGQHRSVTGQTKIPIEVTIGHEKFEESLSEDCGSRLLCPRDYSLLRLESRGEVAVFADESFRNWGFAKVKGTGESSVTITRTCQIECPPGSDDGDDSADE